MTAFEIASLVTQYIIGAAQVGIVYYGISRMMQANESRAQAAQQQERENVRRHTETMAALDMQRQALETLIVRTSSQGTA